MKKIREIKFAAYKNSSTYNQYREKEEMNTRYKTASKKQS